jgi:hypothetical protein
MGYVEVKRTGGGDQRVKVWITEKSVRSIESGVRTQTLELELITND